MRAGQVSVAVLIDKFVSATALIKFQEVQQTLSLRKDKEVCFSRRCSRYPPARPRAALPVLRVRLTRGALQPGSLLYWRAWRRHPRAALAGTLLHRALVGTCAAGYQGCVAVGQRAEQLIKPPGRED
jgi:hypothetical protein